MTRVELDALSKRVMSEAYRVHTAFGPGLLESADSACFVHALRQAGMEVKVEVPVPIVWERVKLTDVGYRIDILVENEL